MNVVKGGLVVATDGAGVLSMPKLALELVVKLDVAAGCTGAPGFRRKGLLEPKEWSLEDIVKEGRYIIPGLQLRLQFVGGDLSHIHDKSHRCAVVIVVETMEVNQRL